MRPTIEERAADIVSARRFANREKREIARRIIDFMDIPTHTPFRGTRLTPAERALAKHRDLLRNLQAHLNARYYGWMVQSGQIP